MINGAGTHETADVVVIGGGIAGLVSAWELARSGRRVLLLEAGPALGGCVARTTVAGIDLDSGAESFATATSAVTELIGDLGLSDKIVSPNSAGAWVRHQAGTAPLPSGSLLGIPSAPFSAEVRRVLGPLGAARAAADRWLPTRIGAGESTLGGLVRARMGSSVVRRLVEPVAGGVYSSDPDGLELASVNPRLPVALGEEGNLAAAVRKLRAGAARPGSAVAGLAGGMFTLVEALRAQTLAAGGRIELSAAVSKLRRAGDGWTISTGTGEVTAGSVVVAVPGPVAAGLLMPVTTDHRALSNLAAPTTEVLLAMLVVDAPQLDAAPRGTGILVSRHAHGVTAKALTHATAKWAWLAEAAGPGRHVLRLSYGRGSSGQGALPHSAAVPPSAALPHSAELPAAAELAELPTVAELTELARRDAAELLGVPLSSSQVVASTAVRWSSALPAPRVGHADAVSAVRSHLPPGLSIVGSHLAGTGLAAVIADARRAAASLQV